MIKSHMGGGSDRALARVGPLAMFGLILVAGAALRFHAIGRSPLFLDEFWFDELATGRGGTAQWDLPQNVLLESPPRLTSVYGHGVPRWWSVWTHMNGVTHPLLYPLALHTPTSVNRWRYCVRPR